MDRRNGLKENFMRPAGGGRYGFWLGSFRPDPTGWASAASLGSSSREMSSLPTRLQAGRQAGKQGEGNMSNAYVKRWLGDARKVKGDSPGSR